jgi:competence protein ComEC
MILATHPDADHIGGLVDVLLHYTVHVIVMTENESDSPVFAAFERAVEAEGATLIFARAGQVYDLGEGSAGSTILSILFPDHDPRELQSNSASIVARLSYGESSYLLTGDSPSTIEGYLIAKEGGGLSSDILKLGHHGSRTSTDDAFLEAVHPTLGIISAGRDNEYGHPHPEVLTRLQQHGVAYENTAEEGSIVSVSDGKEIWLR